ncbi:Thaumatin-like protein 1 [Morella rubra]|uniref:Thaumatin-like protein 1 n=1 Tax=Morella rubra TaxID=262757 RepID=A0A6A1WB01_9ROSI|nr:Thaumatin-like protein 1 [Morella rubra]
MKALAFFGLILALFFLPGAHSARITFKNNCPNTIWPVTADQKPQLSTTGFELTPQAFASVDVQAPWIGRFWARTNCSTDASGKFSCTTADCASGGRSDLYFHYENRCSYTVWLAASPSVGDADPERSPETLEIFSMPDEWTGSIWARTNCANNASFYFSCETGDCGSGTIDCQSPPPTYPVTLLNFDIKQSVVSYEVSLNHGHNLPVRIQPVGGSLVDGGGSCPVVDCVADISNVCPGGRSDVYFHYENRCSYTVWLAASPSIGDADPECSPETLEIFSMPDEWTGSIWARTNCANNASFYFSCETGDCGSGTIDCQSPPPTYPVTLLNFDIKQSVVSYEVSLNHGHNLPVRIQPVGGSLVDGGGSCPVVDCVADISNVCPGWELLDRRKTENPMMNWKIPALSNEMDMKDNIKSGAHTVAFAVRC